MSLLDLQRTMRDMLCSDDEDGAALSSGAEIYRNAYRSRLLDALRTSFERTRRWVGEEAFDAAACHHVIQNPPASWTLDDYGADFDATLAELFARDPEVAELAWLEWHMQRAFAAPDGPVLTAADLAAGPFADGDWEDLRIEFQGSLAARPVRTACVPLWLALRDDTAEPRELILSESAELIVWRNGFSPQFRLVDPAEQVCLAALRQGTTFGAVCEELAVSVGPEAAVTQIGSMLSQWLHDGMISGLSKPPPADGPCGNTPLP